VTDRLNELGLAVVNEMFTTLAAHGAKAAKEVRARHYERYGTKHVDWAARTWMKERQEEFQSELLWVELKNWSFENFPSRGSPGRTRRPTSRRRAERREEKCRSSV
jgi:hypothetical protein